MLKSLEISGFKSFAKKTELNFKSQITGIVGPNGSGKSNVAEAFRFALGEQSIKSMRGKRGEDLIWNGSNEVGRANRASVKMVLDNSKNTFKNFLGGVEFEEVSIERVVNRDGSNEYLLNGSQVRLKDVMELLSEAHIGASGHHIISQGEADRVLTANMKERREMIEDALGLKIYQYKREESERKLQKTEENIKQVESLRREIAPHLKFLKKQVEKVERAEELRNKLIAFYREYLKREKIYVEEEQDKIKEEKKPLEKELHRLESEMEKAKDVLDRSSKKDGKSEELLKVEDKIKNTRDEKDRLVREVGKIEGEISATERRIEEVREHQAREDSKTVLLRDVEELEREVSRISEIQVVINKIREFIWKHKDSRDQKELDNLLHVHEKLLNKRAESDEKIKDVEKELIDLDREYNSVKNSIEQDKNSEREAEKAIFKIAGEQSELRGRLNVIESETQRINIIEEDWKREIKEGGVLLGTALIGWENIEIFERDDSRNKQEERRRELEKMKIRLEELGGAGGGEVMKEYKETEERDQFLGRELEDLKKSAESLEILIKELLEKLDVEFKHGITKINKAFQEFFSLMFGGGTASLQVTKSEKRKAKNLESELEELQSAITEGEKEELEGIEIDVSLPRKKIRGLEMLSGGERALTSIALLFAISQVNPPPFIILDETDAALDEANSKKYGDMIESLSKYSQLILITHNRETMSRAGVIYGVTMGRDSVSRLLSIAFDEAVIVAK